MTGLTLNAIVLGLLNGAAFADYINRIASQVLSAESREVLCCPG